jgi:hypothetical protein
MIPSPSFNRRMVLAYKVVTMTGIGLAQGTLLSEDGLLPWWLRMSCSQRENAGLAD